jgi:hypothetical protein
MTRPCGGSFFAANFAIMRLGLITIAILFALGCVRAQTINLSDSLRDVFSQRISPSFKFETRNSFITGNDAKIYGIKAGVNFGSRLTLGLGYNFIGTDLREELVVDGVRYNADIEMNYWAPFAEYSFYRRGPWELSAPIQIGIGNSFLRISNNEESRIVNKGRVVLYEPGMAFEFKILKLIGVGVGVGYRIMLKNNRDIQQQFTSPVYALRVRLIFDELYKRYNEYNQSTEAK